MSLDEGSCVLLSPGYGHRREKFVPIRYDPIKIEDREMEIQARTEDCWNEFLTRAIARGVGSKTVNPNEITKRVKDFQTLCPLQNEDSNITNLEDLLKV